ncbi:MAG: 3-deoxy-D-manno-octulosonic acid transferase [Thermoguttaceae bacterium]|nr:3-deoxy-D-manno-octulosonic acid transferase [Thermoguttaceae bacterium]
MLDLIYLLALVFASPFLFYRAVRQKKYRDGWGQKFLGRVPVLPTTGEGKKRIWLHAVSVGEVNLLKPIVAQIDADYPNWEFVVSSTSKTGLELAKKLFGDRTAVFYCPLDFSWAVKRALRRIKPNMLVLAELELWPNLIKKASRSGVKVAIVNGRVSDGSFKIYYRIRMFLASTFRKIDLIVAQDDVAANYFRSMSPVPERVNVSGSIKFDGVKTDRNNSATQALAKLAGVRESDVVYMCGSTQDPEEKGALEVYRRLRRDYPALKLIVVPRHKERFEDVAKLLDASGFPWTRRSAIAEPVDPAAEQSRVVLVDALGELGAWWGLAKIAFVGGSWGARGGQNMLEPAGYGAAVSFGPNTKNFRTIVEALLRENAAKVVADVDEMEAFVKKCLDEPDYAERLGAAARALTIRNAGATKRTLEELARLFDS